MKRTYPRIEPRVATDETRLVYHLRRGSVTPEAHYVILCGADLVGVLEPITHAVQRGMTLCPDCDEAAH
jgi:hypothetical protein